MNRLLDLVLYALLAAVVAWYGYDFFIAVRPVEYFAEKPIRLLYIAGFATWLGSGLACALSLRRTDS